MTAVVATPDIYTYFYIATIFYSLRESIQAKYTLFQKERGTKMFSCEDAVLGDDSLSISKRMSFCINSIFILYLSFISIITAVVSSSLALAQVSSRLLSLAVLTRISAAFSAVLPFAMQSIIS